MPEADGTETVDEIVERKLAERLADEEKKRTRSKQPKDFAEYRDVIKQEVKDAIAELAGERRQAADDADEEPTRGDGKSSIAAWWGGK